MRSVMQKRKRPFFETSQTKFAMAPKGKAAKKQASLAGTGLYPVLSKTGDDLRSGQPDTCTEICIFESVSSVYLHMYLHMYLHCIFNSIYILIHIARDPPELFKHAHAVPDMCAPLPKKSRRTAEPHSLGTYQASVLIHCCLGIGVRLSPVVQWAE